MTELAYKTTEEVKEDNIDFEVRSLDSLCINESDIKQPWWYDLKYLSLIHI